MDHHPPVLPGIPQPWLFAHRGLSARAPENTMAAFALAVGAGATGIELDVQQCATGEIVICHDWTLNRTAGADVTVTEASLAELNELDVGRWFAPAFAGERIPRLTDVLDAFGKQACFDIEIKHRSRHRTPLEPRLAEVIRARRLESRVIVSSFNPFAVRAFRHVAPGVPTALIYSDDPEVPRWLRHGGGRHLARPAILKPHRELVNTRLLSAAVRAHRAVLPWTVNDTDEATRLVTLGCAGVISDDPAAAWPSR